VLALIRWRGAAEDGRFLKKEELLAVAVEYGHVELVQHLTKMNDVDVDKCSDCFLDIVRLMGMLFSLEDCKPKNGRFTDQEDIFSDNHHFLFLKPIGSAARMGNVDMVMSLLACDRIDLNRGKPLHWAAAMGHPDVVEMLLQSKKQVDVNSLKIVTTAT
jgi:ankyrin repeat protein